MLWLDMKIAVCSLTAVMITCLIRWDQKCLLLFEFDSHSDFSSSASDFSQMVVVSVEKRTDLLVANSH